MGGFQRLIFRIAPLVMLICFICIGITHTFTTPNQTQPITYLSSEVITINDNNTETTEDDTTITNYSFDFATYRQNISVNKLKEATQNVLDLQAYENTLATFNLLWEDGYQIGDISRTILNAMILVVNTLFVAINIFIMPLRIATAILLTILSLIGINISRTEGIIIPFLNIIVDKATIPLINRTDENASTIYDNLTNTTWVFKNTIEIPKDTTIVVNKGIEFTSNNTQYTKIIISNTKGTGILANTYYTAMAYETQNGTLTQVYTDGTWSNNAYKTIYFNEVSNNDSNTTLSIWLDKIATKQETTPIDNNTYQWYETAINHYTTQNVETYTVFTTFTSNDENFNALYFGIDSNDWLIAYRTYNNDVITVCENGNWIDIYYRQFKLTTTEQMDPIWQTNFNQLLTKNFITIYAP